MVRLIIASVVAVALAGCTKENLLPLTELPKKPLSSSIKCEKLTDEEKAVCLKEAKEAKQVCRKVEKNEAVCTDQQDFVQRLYDARDGK